MTMRPIVRLVLAGIAGLALVVPMTVGATAGPRGLEDRIELPDGFQPEGIAIGRGPTAYFGSRGDGDIYAANLKTGRGRIISQGPGTGSIGLKYRKGLLYVSGGPAGTARVVSVRAGRTVQTYQLATPGAATFVNDVVLSKRFAWFTDSQAPQLYRVPLARRGRLAPQSAVRTIPLSGDWVQGPGFNANGIALTPDRKALLVVQSQTGFLFRVNPVTGVARRVDLGGRLLTNGDGLLVKGRILYAVRNQLNLVAVVKLNRRGTSGQQVAELTSPAFDVPTTVAAYRGSLFLPNARFGVENPTTATYNVIRIDAFRR